MDGYFLIRAARFFWFSFSMEFDRPHSEPTLGRHKISKRTSSSNDTEAEEKISTLKTTKKILKIKIEKMAPHSQRNQQSKSDRQVNGLSELLKLFRTKLLFKFYENDFTKMIKN